MQRFEVPMKGAEGENVILSLEDEHERSIGSGEEFRRLLDPISSKNIGLIWNRGNAYFSREILYPHGYKLIKDRIVDVHIKDAGKDEKGKSIWLPVGKGEIDFKGRFRALDESNFSGVIYLETHYVPEGGSQEDGTRRPFATISSTLQSLKLEIEE